MSTLVGYKDLPQEINEQINKVIHVWKEQVSDKLIGVYLHGSISLEAFHPESGDIDILVVVKDSLTVEEKLSIAKDIIEIDGKPRPIEISAIK
ncbi:MAG: nucleotidyltransferase domain-containing protein [Lachnospiraceae bacterium]|nr:nucleotidyltransferase domain-containing protein [Lachnospiraceae bacterium]